MDPNADVDPNGREPGPRAAAAARGDHRGGGGNLRRGGNGVDGGARRQRRGRPRILGGPVNPPERIEDVLAAQADDGRVERRRIFPFSYIAEYERTHGITDQWSFENVATYIMGPEEDWGECIRQHAKIALVPGERYVVSRKVQITSACYIIGNGATVVIQIEGRGPAFQVQTRDHIPCIEFMERVCFSGIIFENGPGNKVPCFVSENNILLHGCVFSGSHLLCLDLRGGGEVRGCYFIRAVCGIRSKGLYTARVKHCVFEKCVFGVVVKSKLNLSHSSFYECNCSLCMSNSGSVSHCYFGKSDQSSLLIDLALCTCEGGGAHAVPLGDIHFGSNREEPWPKFSNNVLNRMRLYLGRRRELFFPKFCMLGLSVISAPPGVVQGRICLSATYESSAAVVQMVKQDFSSAEERLCTCGERHFTPTVINVLISDEIKPNRQINSLDTAEFMSSDEDD
ncbi:large T antigen [Equine adenovirus 1]|uniref:E1B 55 kDa protein n=1 Tax=Equine adenovirus A serotype 1 TaxID=46916 RepID=G5CZ73_ADEE1|nr:large T-antigen [Equine adenovirus 1]AEP16428.1 large T-antigen [Equine adenovirus 1]ANG08545.1 large T antigen [Equine adenovirus 1]